MKLLNDEILILKAVILYILKYGKDSKRDVYSIVKTAYYAQINHFLLDGTPLFRDEITALKFGPVPSAIYNILRLARGEKDVLKFNQGNLNIASDSIDFKEESFFAKEEPDLNYLSISDIECLNKAIQKVGTMRFDDIVYETHGKEWIEKYNSSRSKIMSNLKIAKEAGADESTLNFLKEYYETYNFSHS